jgi:hypothetical protein
MNWLSRFLLANWSHLLAAVLLSISMFVGFQIGESKIQRNWDEERIRNSVLQAKQEQHTEEVHRSQTLINQQISNELIQKSKILADRKSLTDERRMCNLESSCVFSLPSVPSTSPGAEAPTSNNVSSASRDPAEVTCSLLAQDAAQTTLMLIELQRWFDLQSEAFK